MTTTVPSKLDKVRWALARLTFISYIAFSVLSLVGGFLTAPLMTWYFFGDWRFWRHWRAGRRLFIHAIRLLSVMLKDKQGFMFSVPLTTPPRSLPDSNIAALNPNWPNGSSCGNCNNCCRAGGYACPLLDETQSLCQGYDSFYWRYFNCGRFPSSMAEIDYYSCGKWLLVNARVPTSPASVIPVNIGTLNRTSNIDDKSADNRKSAAG